MIDAPAPAGWVDRVHACVDSLLASGRFRRWAASFPLTRPIARRRARELFDLCAGFVYSQILLACVRLRVFEIVAEGPQSADALSRRTGIAADRAVRLLDAAVALRLLARRKPNRYALGPLGAVLVGNQALLAMIEHHSLLYADLADPLRLLREGPGAGQLSGYWPYAKNDDPSQLESSRVARYSALMSASQPLVAEEVLDAFPLHRHRCLLDVGGGEGAFLAAAAARTRSLRLMLFDLPAVAALAQTRLAAAGLADRVAIHGGSFLTDSLPGGADVVSLIRVLHDHDDAGVLRILRAIRRALPPDGVLLIAEPMAGTPGAQPMGDAYFGFYLMAMGSGRPRTADRLGELLCEAGFDKGREIATRLPIQTRILVARPAGAALSTSGYGNV